MWGGTSERLSGMAFRHCVVCVRDWVSVYAALHTFHGLGCMLLGSGAPELNILLFMCRSICPFPCLSIDLSVVLSIDLAFCWSFFRLGTRSFNWSSFCQSVDRSLVRSFFRSVDLLIVLSIGWLLFFSDRSLDLAIGLSFCQSFFWSVSHSVGPSFGPSFCCSIFHSVGRSFDQSVVR